MTMHFNTDDITAEGTDSICRMITEDLTFSIFKEIADTFAPSQCVSYTRAPVIERILDRHATGNIIHSFHHDYMGTGNIVLKVSPRPRIVFVAHADEISYLIADDGDGACTSVLPFCAHRADGAWPVRVLRYDEHTRTLRVRATGILSSEHIGGNLSPYLTELSDTVAPGDRVVFYQPLTRDASQVVWGKVDNAAGVAACLMSLVALAAHGRRPPVWFLFPDEEEGPPYSNSTFARGSRRFIHAAGLPADTLFTIIDGHYAAPDSASFHNASYAEKESLARGTVVPPDLYCSFKQFASLLSQYDILTHENLHYVPRSDSPAMMERYRNILLLGYPVTNSHFDLSSPSTSLRAIVALARTLACLALTRIAP